MSENLKIDFKESDLDLIKYFLLLIKNFKKIILFSLISTAITFGYLISISATYKSKLTVSENELFSFLLEENTNNVMNELNFNSSILFAMQNEIFLNFDDFALGYKNLDENIKLKINEMDLFDSLEILDQENSSFNSATYVLTSNLDTKFSEEILKVLVLNSQTVLFNRLISILERKILRTVNIIDNKRKDKVDEVREQKLRLEFEASKIENLSSSIISNEIKNLKNNYEIAKSMGYIDPIFNTNELIIQINKDFNNSNTSKISTLSSNGKNYDEDLLNETNRYFYGTKILSQQIRVLEKEMNRKINYINPQLANEIEFIDSQTSDEFILDLRRTKNDLKMFQEAKINLNELKNLSKKSSFITTFNIDRISSDRVNRSDISTYIIALILGTIIGCAYVIINYIINRRLLDENELELINIAK